MAKALVRPKDRASHAPKRIPKKQKNEPKSKAIKKTVPPEDFHKFYEEYVKSQQSNKNAKIKLKNAPKKPIIKSIPTKDIPTQKVVQQPKPIKKKSEPVSQPRQMKEPITTEGLNPYLIEEEVSRKKSPSTHLINSLWKEIEKYPNVSILANGAFSFVIAKTLTLNVKIVLDKNIFQPYEKIETKPYCTLMVLYVPGKEEDEFEYLLSNLMKVGCPFHKISSLDKAKKLLAEES
jgi:hypothetical protein